MEGELGYWAALVNDVTTNWILYASMPLVAAAIGFVTKIVAIWMMFHPIEFFGKPPYLGWQGIVPRKAGVMATIACDTMTSRLISPEDIFNRLDADRIAAEIEKPLLGVVDEMTREVASVYAPGLWESAPEMVKKQIIQHIQKEAPEIVRSIMNDIKADIDSVFDLKDMVITNLMRDKELLNRIFLEVGSGEFRFIRNSGLFFGFAIGIVQAVTWALTQSPWIMPLFGGFTGWFTDWLALKMIFNPKEPTRYLGLVKWQGMFHKRRMEVSSEYGRMIAKQIVTPKNIIDAVLRGRLSDRLFLVVQKQVQRVIDEQSGIARPVVVFAVGGARYQELKRLVSSKIMERLPDTLSYVEGYAAEAMDLENTLSQKMTELTNEEFEDLLRPAFKQDEWILITVGAVLGALVGEFQVQVMLHLAGAE